MRSCVKMSGKTALVTAGSRGLGAEIARDLAHEGANVAVTYISDDQAASALVGELESQGCSAVAIRADAREHTRARQVVSEVGRQLGDLDVLVCNAGAARSAPLIEMTEEEWDDAVDISLKSAFNYISAAGSGFVDRKYGKIVCIGSINGLRGRIGTAGYNAAKAGLLGLVKTAAAELGPSGVNVNLVAPGYIETPSQEGTPMLIRDLVVKETALRRLGSPRDIAPLVTFLCSDAARHITGQTIRVDAGQYL
jgi:3-oxoacyl-[acyl-carrier protein] reductase